MTRRFGLLSCALLAAVCLVATGVADDKEKAAADKPEKEAKFTAKCPVSGRDAKKEALTAYKEKEVYFCCDNCKGKATDKTGDDQLALVFSEDAFKKAFVVKKAKKDKGDDAEKADKKG